VSVLHYKDERSCRAVGASHHLLNNVFREPHVHQYLKNGKVEKNTLGTGPSA